MGYFAGGWSPYGTDGILFYDREGNAVFAVHTTWELCYKARWCYRQLQMEQPLWAS